MNDVTIRPAAGADRDAVWPLARDFATSFVPEREAFEASYDALLARDDTLLLVAESADLGVVGYLLGSVHGTFLANGPVAWVEEVMVDEQARRTGVGAALMAASETWAVEQGAAYLSLASRRAGDFYLALGYEDSAVFYKKVLAEGS
jgi:GNAT superfamily N-acetyltransferase